MASTYRWKVMTYILDPLLKLSEKLLDQAESELGVTKWGNKITIHFWNHQTM